jgi:putative oxidoreductase
MQITNVYIKNINWQITGGFMKSFLGKFEGPVYSIFRIIIGFLFFWHGSLLLFKFPVPMAGAGEMSAVLLYTIGILDFLGGVLVMTGLFTSITAFIVSGEMAVAYWMVHASHAVLPILNQGELSVLYCFAFLYIAARGPGLWSIDRLIFKK